MKRMKRVLALGMAVLMCMGLTACGKDFDAAGYKIGIRCKLSCAV